MASKSFGQVFRVSTFVTVFFFLSMASSALSDDAKIRVLFIGNSLTTVNDLPKLIADLAKSRGHPMEYDVYAPGGKTLAQHASDPVALDKIKKTGWDFVVLQEQSQAPSFSQGQVQQEVYPFARELSRLIKKASPEAHVVFYMTMAKKNGDQHNAAKVSPELGTYEGMQSRINQSYVNMAMNNDALIAPVGLVWKRVREQYPSIDLYADEIHPNLTGSYLAACVFYTVFFNDTAAGLAHPSVIDGQTASAIQGIIDEEAMGRLELIMGGPPSHWQTNKALFEHYGGRVFKGNLGYYSPIEASLRLFQEMESKGDLEFFDPKLRSRVIKNFETWMLSTVEPDEFQDELQKLYGMRSPWEYPFWSKVISEKKMDMQ